MATRLRTPAKIKALTKLNPKAADLWQTITALRRQKRAKRLNDRARIIFATSILDQQLQIALLSHFPPIDSENKEQMAELFEGESAPLASFSSRIRVAYALGVFGSKTKADLERIKGIRNACAHSRVHVHFRDKAIAEECRKFNALRLTTGAGVLPVPQTAEEKFFFVVEHYFMAFTVQEREDEMPTPLRYLLSPYGRAFS